MSLCYRYLGVIARLNQRLSRFSINLVPMNWIVAVLLAIGFCTGLGDTRDALTNGQEPRSASVGAVLDYSNLANQYVTLTGTLYSQYAFTQTHHTWVPLADPQRYRGILVALHDRDSAKGPPRREVITGMIRPMDRSVRDTIQNSNNPGASDTNYVLMEGQHPGGSLGGLLLAGTTGILFVTFLVTFLLKYIVFQKTAERITKSDGSPVEYPQNGIDLRYSGRLALHGTDGKRFLNMPARLVTLETGELAFVANINASSNFMGITVVKRVGLWISVILPGSLGDSDLGLLYVGFARRPAVRIRYTDGTTGKPALSVLSFGTERERQIVIQDLDRAAGHTLTATVVR